jgi:hypothetical protein
VDDAVLLSGLLDQEEPLLLLAGPKRPGEVSRLDLVPELATRPLVDDGPLVARAELGDVTGEVRADLAAVQ